MHRFEHRHAVRVEVGGRSQADPAGHGTAEIGEDVTEQVVGDDDVVALGPVDEVNAGRIDMVVRGLDLGVLLRDRVEGALPQVTRKGQHIGFVHECQVLLAGHGQLEGVTNTPLHTVTGIDRSLRGDLVRRVLAEEAAFTGVGALCVLANHDEIMTGHTIGTESAEERAVVDVEIEFEAHPQKQASFDDAGRNAWTADRAGIERIDAAPFFDDLIGENRPVTQVALAAEVVVDALVLDAKRVDDLEAFGNDLGADAVTTHDADAVRHVGTFLKHEKPPTEVDGRAHAGNPACATK